MSAPFLLLVICFTSVFYLQICFAEHVGPNNPLQDSPNTDETSNILSPRLARVDDTNNTSTLDSGTTMHQTANTTVGSPGGTVKTKEEKQAEREAKKAAREEKKAAKKQHKAEKKENKASKEERKAQKKATKEALKEVLSAKAKDRKNKKGSDANTNKTTTAT